eukprot:12202200-Ditylum_brightwellii.AAC.1
MSITSKLHYRSGSKHKAGTQQGTDQHLFMSSRQMELWKETLVQLGQEEIKKVEDLAEFSKENWKQVADNLERRGGQMKNQDKNKTTTTLPRFLKPCIHLE